jgi:hypothetical protein
MIAVAIVYSACAVGITAGIIAGVVNWLDAV